MLHDLGVIQLRRIMSTHRISLVFDVRTSAFSDETELEIRRRLLNRAEYLLMEICRPWTSAEPVLVQVDQQIRLLGGRLEPELFDQDPR